MKKVLSYILTPIYFIVFGLLLLFFHPIQVLCKKVGGYESHKKSVDILNLLLFKGLKIVGAKISIQGFNDLPDNRPVIIVSNHQSAYDIPPIIWLFRKNHPKFISKIELAKNIPSISYNLKHSGAALIERRNGGQSVKEIIKLGRLIEKYNYAACIFPEGTRTRTGKLKRFHPGGIKTLLKASPSAVIVPFVIDGNFKLHKYGAFPMSFGETLKFTALPAIDPTGLSAEEVVAKTENAINNKLGEQL